MDKEGYKEQMGQLLTENAVLKNKVEKAIDSLTLYNHWDINSARMCIQLTKKILMGDK
jgi:hypothetical protein